jgi:hypothetical protein
MAGIIYSDLPQSNTLANPFAFQSQGCLVVSYRTGWNSLQKTAPAIFPTSDPNDPSWLWGFFDSGVQQARSLEQDYFLRVLIQRNNCPAWMKALAAPLFVDSSGSGLCVYWNAAYQQGVIAMIQAIAARYGSDPLFKALSMNICSSNSGDWSVPHANTNFTIGANLNCPAYGASGEVVLGAGQSVTVGWYCQVGVGPANNTFLEVTAYNQNTNVATFYNPGFTGNASSGVIPSGTSFLVDDVDNWQCPAYGYTTAQLVTAVTDIISAAHAVLPNVIFDQEVGRNGHLDPYP